MIRLVRVILVLRHSAPPLLPFGMVYDFRTDEVSLVLTLQAIHAYIWSLSLTQVRWFCWSMLTEAEHEKTMDWCQGGLPSHRLANGQKHATRHTDYYVGADQGPREPRGCRRY